MRLSLIAPFAAMILAVATGHAATRHASHAVHVARYTPNSLSSTLGTLDAGELDSVAPGAGTRPVVRLPETIVTGSAPSRRAVTFTRTAAPVAWVCGPVEENGVGGSQRTCEYRMTGR